jgi:ribose-phosphate pyrophosphokinase
VIAGPASIDLASRISTEIGGNLVVPELRVFPDGESKLRIPHVGDLCAVVQSTYPPTDTHLLQAMMISSKCAESGAEVCAVIPYLAYARQDRPFLEGESVTISLISKLLAASGVKCLITVDIHSKLAIGFFPKDAIENISSIPLLAEYAKSMKLNNPVAVSPDAGGAERVVEFARVLGCDSITLKKSRDRATGEVSVEPPNAELGGRDAVLVDDMISSGGSIVKAAQALQHKGASRVYAMCAHGLLLGDSAKRIEEAGVSDIITTNSIPNKYSKVDLGPAISRAIASRYRE